MNQDDPNQIPDTPFTAEWQRKMKHRQGKGVRPGCVLLGIALVIVASLAVSVPLVSWAFDALRTAGDAANRFMLALRDGDDSAAYALLADDVQQQIRHREGVVTWFGGRPQDWQFYSFNVDGDSGRVLGEMTLNGERYTLTLTLIGTGGDWRVSSAAH